MVWVTVLLLSVLSMSDSATDAIACIGWVIYGVHAGGAGEEFYDLECAGPDFEDLCLVMYTDNHVPQFDNHFQFGCLEKGNLDKCGKRLREHGVDNYYCCCMDANCNDKNFAAYCRKNITAPAEGELAPGRDYNRLHRMKHILLNMRI